MDVRESVGRCELDSSGSGQGPVVGSYEHGNEPSRLADCLLATQEGFYPV
jgi:hypothetical protein